MGLQALGFQKKLMRFLVREFDDLVLDRGAIARADAVNLAAVHGRAMHVLADDAMRLRRGVGDVARHLRLRDPAGAEAERRGVGVARLRGETRPVDGAAIQTRRRAGLEAAAAQAQRLQKFAQQHGSRLAAASGGIMSARRSG